MGADFFYSDQVWEFRFFFAVFAILMLPFACVFLSSRVRRRLGKLFVMLGLVVLLVIVPIILTLTVPGLLESDYVRFLHKDQRYYADLAHACDEVIQQHPLGTNATVLQIAGTNQTWAFIHIPGNDASLPKIIRKLNPSEITISSNSIGIMVGIRDFGLSWAIQDGSTNSWALSVVGEGLSSTVYMEKK